MTGGEHAPYTCGMTPTKPRPFGDRLKQLREGNNLTQLQVAFRMSKILERPISEKQISGWENSPGYPHASFIPALAQAVGVPIAALYSENGDDPENTPRT